MPILSKMRLVNLSVNLDFEGKKVRVSCIYSGNNTTCTVCRTCGDPRERAFLRPSNFSIKSATRHLLNFKCGDCAYFEDSRRQAENSRVTESAGRDAESVSEYPPLRFVYNSRGNEIYEMPRQADALLVTLVPVQDEIVFDELEPSVEHTPNIDDEGSVSQTPILDTLVEMMRTNGTGRIPRR